MKKIASIIGAVAIVATISSCKKNWTCECTTTCGSTSTTVSATSGKMKKKDAEAWCNQGNVSSSGCSSSCKLK
ncbi:MAG: hypothetical protein Fur0023_16940 [Bacteroidia bacterium]